MAKARSSGLAKLVLIGVLGLSTVLLAEIVLRIYNPIYVPLRANKIVLPVNNKFVQENKKNDKTDPVVITQFNSLGFRGPDLPDQFSEYLSLVTVGGSTTACVALTDGKTWPDLAASRLKDHLPNFWLNNAGFDGHSTFGHLQLLNQALAEIKPDYILYLVGVNDIGRDDLNTFDSRQEIGNLSLRNRLIASSELLSTIQVVSRTFRAIELDANHHPGFDFATLETIDTPADVAEELVKLHLKKYVPGYLSRLTSLVDNTLSIGSKPILMTQPALWGEGVDQTLGIDIGILKFKDNVNSKTRWEIMELYNKVTRDVAKEKGVFLIELAGRMPKNTKYYYDWIHYSNEGAEKVAEIVSSELLQYFSSEKEGLLSSAVN